MILNPDFAERVYTLLVEKIGVAESSRAHFVGKWVRAPRGFFRYSLGETPYTFDENTWLKTYSNAPQQLELMAEINTTLTEMLDADLRIQRDGVRAPVRDAAEHPRQAADQVRDLRKAS